MLKYLYCKRIYTHWGVYSMVRYVLALAVWALHENQILILYNAGIFKMIHNLEVSLFAYTSTIMKDNGKLPPISTFDIHLTLDKINPKADFIQLLTFKI